MDLERVYREHAQGLLRFLTRYCGDQELAADAVQESFLRLSRASPREESVRAWLFRTGVNFVLDAGRTKRRQLRILGAAPDRVPVGEASPQPDEELDRRERRERVASALDALSERDRRVLLLRAEGFLYREIADELGITTQSVGSVLLRATRKLAGELDLIREPSA